MQLVEPWEIGAAWNITSVGATSGVTVERKQWVITTKLRWVSIAPLGFPVVPDV